MTDYTHGKIIELAGDPDEHGYRSVTINLQAGDTAYAPGTTKYVLRGEGAVEYVIHPSGIRGHASEGVFRSHIPERLRA